MTDYTLLSLALSAVALLLSGNLYFIKKLVDKIEDTGKSHESLKVSFSNVSLNVNEIGVQMRDLKADLKDLRRIEIEVAVLRSQINQANSHAHAT